MIHIKRTLIESILLLFPNDHMMLQECTTQTLMFNTTPLLLSASRHNFLEEFRQ